jgi:hypothetical protein
MLKVKVSDTVSLRDSLVLTYRLVGMLRLIHLLIKEGEERVLLRRVTCGISKRLLSEEVARSVYALRVRIQCVSWSTGFYTYSTLYQSIKPTFSKSKHEYH